MRTVTAEISEGSTRKSPTTTLQDVARLAGTSKGTASRALNGKHWVAPQTRDAVLKAAKELGFQADPTAQRLAVGRGSNLVGLFTRSLDLGVVTLKLQLLQNALNEKGYNAPIQASGASPSDPKQQAQAMANLCRQRPAAVLCYTLGLHDETLRELQHYCDEGGIAVCYDTPFELKGERADYVVFDRADNTYQATRHLVQLGHHKIGFFSVGTEHDPDRLLGFKRALREGGLSMSDAASILSTDLENPREITIGEQVGQRLGEHFSALRERPTAMCITDDYVAAGFIATVQRRGLRVPQDVSVVGHDNMPVAAYSSAVPLTSVTQPVEAIVEQVVRSLDSRLSGEYDGASRRAVVCGELIQRESTAPPVR